MTNTRQPICFLATQDAAVSERFYSQVMGLPLVDASPYALAFRDGDIMLRVQIIEGYGPADHTAHGWEVADISHEIATLTSRGPEFLQFEHLSQDASGVWTSPDGNKIAWLKDPSGNVLSLTQFCPSNEQGR
ncbi:VOC family protein [Thalassobium sp. R2A62]|uniref:VOC family protein n=1 Tax=Thalassobium sp. R2A62 TaxID=633131 RepID=UPI0001B1D012|nr:VOC family protein [Thalassobium sp. R2A62]EET46741.1 glyoxalase/bleomycin resistance protein/dioxygenase [Thalassobium sp. R2A62]MDG1338920.1 VOC family protein [Paracoccaceae bacterium]MDG2451808.1 VOC family protein [Paracoccaceae bacterium]